MSSGAENETDRKRSRTKRRLFSRSRSRSQETIELKRRLRRLECSNSNELWKIRVEELERSNQSLMSTVLKNSRQLQGLDLKLKELEEQLNSSQKRVAVLESELDCYKRGTLGQNTDFPRDCDEKNTQSVGNSDSTEVKSGSRDSGTRYARRKQRNYDILIARERDWSNIINHKPRKFNSEPPLTTTSCPPVELLQTIPGRINLVTQKHLLGQILRKEVRIVCERLRSNSGTEFSQNEKSTERVPFQVLGSAPCNSDSGLSDVHSGDHSVGSDDGAENLPKILRPPAFKVRQMSVKEARGTRSVDLRTQSESQELYSKPKLFEVTDSEITESSFSCSLNGTQEHTRGFFQQTNSSRDPKRRRFIW